MKQILTSDEMDRAVTRIAHEILERNKGTERLALVGIRTGGAILAGRLREKIESIVRQRTDPSNDVWRKGKKLPLGLLDITLYRDDLSEIGAQPNVGETEIDFDVSGIGIVLVDDVLYTGRTIRCALDALIDLGRPKSIQLAVLIDRGHRELPIKPDYVGKNIPTARTDEVLVRLREHDGEDCVVVAERGA